MKKNNKKGFTLVELVIVVAVMAVLVAVAIPTIGSIKSSAEKAVADSNARTIESVLKLAEANAAVDSNGVPDVEDADYAQAIYDAKLGFTSKDKFAYTAATGTVKAVASTYTAASGEVLITFTDAGVVTFGTGTSS